MNKQLKTETLVFKVDSEQLAMDTIEQYKDNQSVESYTLTKYNTTYKCKKNRKTGETENEYWLVSVTKEYEVM